MKQYQVLLTEPAANDLQLIAGYIADELLETAIAGKAQRCCDEPDRHTNPPRFSGG